jgi:hypothetical protein
MRLSRGVSILAAVASAAALSAPTAGAYPIGAGSGGGPIVASTHQQPASSGTDWGLVGAVGAGGVLVLGAGMTVTRRRAYLRTGRSTGTVA